MFDRTARYYDLFYENGLGKDYAAEAATVADLLPDATTLLDVACGTGLHLQHLSKRFDCVGVDLDEDMLAIARERCPDVPLTVGDMTGFDLGRRFDAVICMFSSIGYARTEEGLRRTAANLAAHLEPGGTIVVEPFLTPDAWMQGHVGVLHADLPELKVTRMALGSPEPDGAMGIAFHYLIGSADGISHEVEHHVLGLFTWEQYRAAFEDAGLEVTIDQTGGPMGRGLITGRQPS